MATGVAISDATELKILDLVFRAAAWAGYADATATTPQTSIGFALHTADPGDAGTQATNEVTVGVYQGYTRINKTRDSNASTGFAAPAAGAISPNTAITFPAGTGGTGGTVSHFSTGSLGSVPALGTMLWYGTLSPATITVGNGITPQLTTATTFGLD